MARGQVRDTLQRHDTLSVESLLRLHDEKTGGFIASSLVVGILLAGGSSGQIESFRKFGFLLGRAFQIRDDILDYEGESMILGKKTGKDLELGKGIVSLVGITESKKILQNLKEEMILLVQDLGDARFFDVVEYVVKREQ